MILHRLDICEAKNYRNELIFIHCFFFRIITYHEHVLNNLLKYLLYNFINTKTLGFNYFFSFRQIRLNIHVSTCHWCPTRTLCTPGCIKKITLSPCDDNDIRVSPFITRDRFPVNWFSTQYTNKSIDFTRTLLL